MQGSLLNNLCSDNVEILTGGTATFIKICNSV